jgi:hypothetical protein
VDENLEFDVRTGLANLGDFIERQLARQDDAGDAKLLPKANGREIDGICLNGQMNRLVGPMLAHEID